MKINNCFCGRKAEIYTWHPRAYSVQCCREDYDCWEGPARKTEAGAIKAWNKKTTIAKQQSKYKG